MKELRVDINSNSDYVSAGFIQNWVDNIDEKPVDARPVSDTVKASVDSDNKLVAKVTENGEDIESAYNNTFNTSYPAFDYRMNVYKEFANSIHR